MTNNKNRISVDISIGSIFWVLAFLIGIKFIANISDVIYLIFLAVLITLATNPLVDWLEKRKINRKISTLVLLFSFFGTLIGLGFSVAKPLAEQTDLFIQRLPVLIENLGLLKIDFSQFQNQFTFVPGQIYKIAIGTIEGVITTLAITVMCFYMIQEMNNISGYLEFWYGKERGNRFYQIIKKLENQIGNWVRGQLILMLTIGVVSYIGYGVIGLPYTLALGVIAGLLEIIPNVGPTVTAILAILVGFSISPAHALGALIISIIIQQLENQLLVPIVMKKAAGLNPVVTMIVLFTGIKLGGPVAGALALPVVLSLRVILAHIKLNKETNIPEIQ